MLLAVELALLLSESAHRPDCVGCSTFAVDHSIGFGCLLIWPLLLRLRTDPVEQRR